MAVSTEWVLEVVFASLNILLTCKELHLYRMHHELSGVLAGQISIPLWKFPLCRCPWLAHCDLVSGVL